MSSIGYARVSSYGQSLEVQMSKLSHCERVFSEKISGKSTKNRDQLSLCLDFVRDGDVLCVTKLDRLARSTRDLLNILNRLAEKKVKLHVIDQQLDTSTASGRLLVTMLGCIAEFENDLRRERQTDGVALARSKGVKFGRKKALTDKQLLELRQKRAEGVKIADLMSEYSLSKASVYRALDQPGSVTV